MADQEQDGRVKLRIDGENYEIDMHDLELDEVGTIEDLTGKSAEDIDWDSARGMQGLAWIAIHRRNPRFTIQEAGRLKFTAFEDPEGDAAPASGAKPRRPTKAGSAAQPGANS
jgi:hypothetical protein